MDTRTMRLGLASFMRQAFLWVLLPTLILFLSVTYVGHAQMLPTNISPTLGAGNLGTQVLAPAPNGNIYGITGGETIGSNLFHSFGDFNVGAGDVAQFQTSNLIANPSMSNILGRVTGGNPSSIFGTIDSATYYPAANLFLINQFGILFEPGASLNVGGAASFTNAQYIRLFDGMNNTNFYANPVNDGLANSILVMEPSLLLEFLSPRAYGFLTAPDPNATITVQGSTLSVPLGQSISLIGGKVIIEGGAQLSAPSGRIHLATTASPGEFAAFEPLPNATSLQSVPNNPVDPASATSFTSYGLMSLTPGSSIEVHGTSMVWIKGGQLVLSVNDATLNTSESPVPLDTISLSPGSSIVTSSSGLDPGADVQITVAAVQMDGPMIQSINSGGRDGGNISINATKVELTTGASVLSSTGIDLSTFAIVGSGKGGNITVQGLPGATGGVADSFTLTNGATIISQTNGPGHGGDILIASGTVQLDTGAQIKTTTSNDFEAGAGGNVSLNVGTLTLMDSASIQSQSFTLTPEFGHGGNISIQGVGPDSAAELVVFSRGSGLLSLTFASGEGGELAIKSKSLKMDESAGIFATTLGEGRGGDILLRVGDASLSGGSVINSHTDIFSATAAAGGTITVEGLVSEDRANSLTLEGGSTILSEAFGQGRLGDIVVRAETVNVKDGSAIQVGTPLDPGTAGNVTIDANSAVISGGSSISSQAFAETAGEVKITADQLILDNSSIDTGTHGFGRAGDVVLRVGSINLSNDATITSSSLSTEAGSGDAGTVTIQGLASSANSVTITDSFVTTNTLGPGQGGAVTIEATAVTLNNSLVSASTSGSGNAGSIMAKVGTLTLTNGAEISSSSTGDATGAAGSVTIKGLASPADAVSITDSTLLTSAANTGQGGSITVDATNLALNNVTISASVRNFDNSPGSTDSAAVGLGNIGLAASTMTMNGNTVTTESSGSRNAGDIQINPDVAGNSFEIQNSTINTSAELSDGGNIDINVTDMLRLTDSIITSSVGNPTKTDTAGGNITIDPNYVILQGSQIRANAYAGSGGNITIVSSVFLADPFSQQNISASSQLGVSGTVNINAPVQNVSGELVVLSQDFSSAAALLAQQCAARVADGRFSTFVVAAREGLPVEPGGFLASPSFLTELGGSASLRQLPPIPRSAAQGLLSGYDTGPIQLAKLGSACRQ